MNGDVFSSYQTSLKVRGSVTSRFDLDLNVTESRKKRTLIYRQMIIVRNLIFESSLVVGQSSCNSHGRSVLHSHTCT